MESKVPASEISNHKLYSELEKVLLDIKGIVDNNKKIKQNRRVYGLLSQRNVTKNYVIKNDEEDGATIRFDDKTLYDPTYERKKASRDRIIINKFQLNNSYDIKKDLYMYVSHELAHVLVGEHRMRRSCNIGNEILDHCYHFFDYLAMFGKDALPKAYGNNFMNAYKGKKSGKKKMYEDEEEFISPIEDSYDTYITLKDLPQTKMDKKEIIKLIAYDKDFRGFLENNIIMVNLDKLDEMEKEFFTKIFAYGKMKASLYIDGKRQSKTM